MIGKSIRIYLPDSSVTGIRYAELVNWTGQSIACPRNRLSELDIWPEANKPGVYFLFEAKLGDSRPLAYIGESENVKERLTSHDRKKDFWNEAVIFTSKDENLTKSHIKFLESSLVTSARLANRYELVNGNTPPESGLPRPDKDAMAEFIENIRMVLGTLGYPVLEPLLVRSLENTVAPVNPEKINSVGAELTLRINTLRGIGQTTDEGFVIKKGSQIQKGNTESCPDRVIKYKEKLISDGKLIDKISFLELSEDILVSSSSYAATLIAGNSRSGP